MKKKNTLVLWHAVLFAVCIVISSHLGLDSITARCIAVLGLCHGVEFVWFVHNYRYIPVRRDYIPVMFFWPSYNLGCLGFKLTSFLYFDFYTLWGGELRCFCRCSNRRYTLFGPGFIRRRR